MGKEKAKVSVYVLAYNEEAKIEDCIKSVLWADEVILIDSHSTDKTAQIAEELGVSESLFIKSAMSFEDLAQHYRSADLVVFPSYYEGQGLIPLEALASGTPVEYFLWLRKKSCLSAE